MNAVIPPETSTLIDSLTNVVNRRWSLNFLKYDNTKMIPRYQVCNFLNSLCAKVRVGILAAYMRL